MRRPPVGFADIAAQLAELEAQREALVLHAFDAVECRYPSLAAKRRRSAHLRHRD